MSGVYQGISWRLHTQNIYLGKLTPILWSNCNQTNLDELFKLQKRCARLILDSPWDARSFDNFQQLKWLPIDQMFKINKLGLLKKVIDGRAPEYLTASLDTLRFEHNYPTRAKTSYCLPKPRTEAMRRTFFYSETISRILQPYNIRVAHKPTTTLRQLLTNVKDRDEPNNRQGAVYKIKCSDCQASYIGETGRNLNTRLTEHKRATRNGDANNHIAVHHQLTNHNIDWDSVQCLTYSTNYFQLLTVESWYTNLEQTPLNRCQQLPPPYKRLIHDRNETDKRTSNRPT